MSNSLRNRILEKIQLQEKTRQEEEKKRVATKEKETQNSIIQGFKEELDYYLRMLKEYPGRKLYPGGTNDFYYQKKALIALGFRLIPRNDYYWIEVASWDGESNQTIAQYLMREFYENLEKARSKRKEELLKICKEIKQKMENGEYSYHIDSMGRYYIDLSSKERITTEYERIVIEEFFRCTPNIYFVNTYDSSWRFRVD